jgi:hypothetical protein
MPNVIKLKRSETAAAAPASLQYGEVAINVTDKKIYIGNSSGATTLIVDGSASGYTAPTLGSTTLTSGATITSIAGLTSVTSTSFVGALTGNASTVTNGVYTTDTGTVTNTMLAGSIANNKLTNSSITVNGSLISLGGSATVTANTTNALTIGTGLSGTSFNGSGAVTIAIDSTVATLTGSQVLTNKTISGSDNTLSNIANASLTNSSITVNGSSISLGGSATVTATATNALTLGTGLTGTSYNGSTAVTAAVDTATIATRAYVDSVAQGLHSHATVKSATTTTLATLTGATVSYAGGAITWTGGNAANGASFNDGTTLTANTTESLASKILVKNEGDGGGLGASKNGTYYVYAARELRRTSDGDQASDWAGGDFCFVTDGTLYNNTGWVQTEAITTLDTDSILWQQFSGAGSFTADETTLTLSGTQFSIKNTYVGQTSITTLGTIATGTWNATAIGATKGGTGQTTYAAGDLIYASNTDVLSKLTKPSATSFLQMTSAGVPSWTDTIPTTDGGTGLTSFTSKGLVYASSASVLATGSVFSVTESSAASNIRKINITSTVGAATGFEATESTYGSTVFIGISSDYYGGLHSYSAPYVSLNNGTTYTSIEVGPAGDSAVPFSAYSFYSQYDGGINLTWLTSSDNMFYATIKIGFDYSSNSYITFEDNASNGNSINIMANILKINTTTPVAGKILTCTDSNGTVSWEDNAAADMILFSMGFI